MCSLLSSWNRQGAGANDSLTAQGSACGQNSEAGLVLLASEKMGASSKNVTDKGDVFFLVDSAFLVACYAQIPKKEMSI